MRLSMATLSRHIWSHLRSKSVTNSHFNTHNYRLQSNIVGVPKAQQTEQYNDDLVSILKLIYKLLIDVSFNTESPTKLCRIRISKSDATALPANMELNSIIRCA